MKTLRRKSHLLFIPALLLAALATQAGAAVTCTSSAGVPALVRSEGYTEPVADLVLSCTGGISTPAGAVVPQINLTLTLNTNLSSHVTQNTASGTSFSEALLLVDEPNSAVNPPQRPLLNCGDDGAPDSGVSGPGVCTIISDGAPADTYDGKPNVYGAGVCAIGAVPPPNTYGCGRPNAFQGRMSTTTNVVEFLGVPFDPPGAGTRIFRFTNIRADAAVFGTSGPNPIRVDIAENGSAAFTITPAQQTLAVAQTGLKASIATADVVHIVEGFANAWKDRNVAFTPANATYFGGSYHYIAGSTIYPPQAAQNVPGTIYNTEDMFQWQNNGLNAPPVPNPPAGFGGGPVANLGTPLDSLGLGGINTEINTAGVSSAGTRIALKFTHTPDHTTVTVPAIVNLYRVSGPSTPSGVMVLTGTDPEGAGVYTPGGSATIADGGIAVYEVLYADPFAIEFADIACTVNHSGKGTDVEISFAPFYTGMSAGLATPTPAHPTPIAVPRFIPASGKLKLSK